MQDLVIDVARDLADKLRTLPGLYGEPGGLLPLARIGAAPAGTIALRRLPEQAVEDSPPRCWLV